MRIEMDWKLCAKNRAERLSSLIALDAPDVLIGSQWHLLWQAMENAYGSDVFEMGQETWGRIDDEIDREN